MDYFLVWGFKYIFKGYKGKVPTSYEITQTFYYKPADGCSDDRIDYAYIQTGSIRADSRPNRYLLSIEHVYYRFSEAQLIEIGCLRYHKPDMYFDLLTSTCPSLQDDLIFSVLDEWLENDIYFYSSYLKHEGTILNLIDSSVCLDDLPDDPLPISNNNAVVWIIVVVLIIIMIIAIIIIVINMNALCKKKHELKKVDKPVENQVGLSSQLTMSYIANTSPPISPQPQLSEPSNTQVIMENKERQTTKPSNTQVILPN